LQALSEEVRWTLLLVDVEELKEGEAAAITSRPLSPVSTKMGIRWVTTWAHRPSWT
jgi:hypothetical protein